MIYRDPRNCFRRFDDELFLLTRKQSVLAYICVSLYVCIYMGEYVFVLKNKEIEFRLNTCRDIMRNNSISKKRNFVEMYQFLKAKTNSNRFPSLFFLHFHPFFSSLLLSLSLASTNGKFHCFKNMIRTLWCKLSIYS